MSKIKGQHFRLLSGSPLVAFPEATNASITLTGNSEDTTTKDTEGLYSQNTVVSTAWNAQVDTYQGAASQLRAIITMFNAAEPIPVGWDQTAGSMNRERQNANFARGGNALLNDFNMVFNDRETVQTSLQFQGTGQLSPLEPSSELPDIDALVQNLKRGQYIRLLVSTAANPSLVVAAAKQMSLHGSAQTEEDSTKDATGDALEYSVVGQSYDITGSGLVLTPNDALLSGAVGLNDFEEWVKDQELYWRICVMEGEHNRTIVEEIAHGIAKCTNLQAQAQTKQNVQYNYTLTGFGKLVPGAEPSSSDI